MLLDRQRVKFWQKIIFGFMAVLMAGFLIFGYSGVASSCTGSNGTVNTGSSALDSQIKTATDHAQDDPERPGRAAALAQAYQSAGFSQADRSSPNRPTNLGKALTLLRPATSRCNDGQLGGDAAKPARSRRSRPSRRCRSGWSTDRAPSRPTSTMIKLQPQQQPTTTCSSARRPATPATRPGALAGLHPFLKLDPNSQYAAARSSSAIGQALGAASLAGALAATSTGPSPGPTSEAVMTDFSLRTLDASATDSA